MSELNGELAAGFVGEIFKGATTGYGHTWTRQGKASQWHTLGSPLDISGIFKPDACHYICPSIFPADLGRSRRGTEKDVIGILGMSGDFDVAHGVHKKAAKLPQTIEEAIGLVGGMPLPPTGMVMSGHGVQAWWLLAVAVMLNDIYTLDRVKAMTTAWGRIAQMNARRVGWVVDSTFDLCRLGRIPGTVNNKEPDAPVGVKLLDWNDGNRWTFEQLEGAMSLPDGVRAMDKVEPVSLDLPEDVNPEFLEALCEANPDAAALRKGASEKLTDSEADLAIGNMARSFFTAGSWEDVPMAVAQVIRAFRSERGKPEKAQRDSYIKPTVARVMHDRPGHGAVQIPPAGTTPAVCGPVEPCSSSSSSSSSSSPQPGPPNTQPCPEESALQVINAILGLTDTKIIRVVRLVADEPEYSLEFDNGRTFLLGGVKYLLSPASITNAVADCARKIVIPPKGVRVDQLRASLVAAVEDVHIGEEATSAGQGRAWTSGYLAVKTPLANPDPLGSSTPWVRADGRIAVVGSDVHAYVRTVLGEGSLGHKGFGKVMRAAGAMPERVNVRVKGGRYTTRSVWVLPRSPEHDAISSRVREESPTEEGLELVQRITQQEGVS